VAQLADAISAPTGLVIVAEEALHERALGLLAAALQRQPSWSDLPVLVFGSSRPDAAADAMLLERLAPLGNVSLLERPLRVVTLVSAVSAALRARRRQYELRGLLDRLQQALRQRDDFLAILGHELRNPLSAALLASENLNLLAQKPNAGAASLAERQRGVIRRQLDLLTRLVDDLLDVSRVTTGKINLHQERLSFTALVQRAVDTIGPQAQQQRLRVESALGAEPLYVQGDGDRLEQVLLNLLRNAIKYTPAEGVVTVTLDRIGDQLSVVVKDTGVGLEPHTLTEIFEPFKQADRSLDRSQGGLGIGLTLVKKLVELHGGVVEARSPGLGLGSEFEVRLPLAARAGPQRAAVAAVQADAPPEGLVFVLEDHADSREGLVVLLQRLGYEVAAESDGARGAMRILELSPRAAIVDIGLPGVDGYEVARLVREAAGDGIFLIALTGYGQADDRKRALDAGFHEHVTKPIDLNRLRSMLGQSRGSRTTA
jgi:signal transduction histidine kinase/CheY-like chemotaxis protein